jgi:hypothetical protein
MAVFVTCLAGLFVGSALTIGVIGGFIFILAKISRLSETGRRVLATVDEVSTHEESSFTFRDHAFRRIPGTRHELRAHWLDQEARKTYVLKANIRNPDKFPVGSSVPFFIDQKHPQWWHRLENLRDV